MTKKLKPNGYVAICQCGCTVGAIDLERTDRKDSGRILGRWISDGCELKPQFGMWTAEITSCQCEGN